VRWDGDTRGRGIADAAAFAPGARELVAAMEGREWVAEQPEAHLLPHIRRWCERAGAPLELAGAWVEPDGVYVVELRLRAGAEIRHLRASAFALLGEIAESATYVRQRREGDAFEYEVVTGMLAGDTAFAPHGHTLRLRIPATAA
jgi:hypothetical protein